jgi:FkbM family methyltransferase
MAAFERERPRDINVEAAIAPEEGELTYFMFNEPALNTLDEAMARERAVGEYRIVERRRVRARPLHDVLREHLPRGQAIDFMSIDVEGLDLQVARSNDWDAYRPEVVLAESSATTLAGELDSELCRFLRGVGYEPFSRTVKTLLLRRR